MDAKELATQIDGRQYLSELTKEEEREAAKSNLVVVYGRSDDLMDFAGAIDDEVDCYDGGTAYITENGVLAPPDCGEGECPYYKLALNATKAITAVWNDGSGASWTYKTDIPHETFKVLDDGELYCVGIVFSLSEAFKN